MNAARAAPRIGNPQRSRLRGPAPAAIPARPVIGRGEDRKGKKRLLVWGNSISPRRAGFFDPDGIRRKAQTLEVRDDWTEFGTMSDLNRRVPLARAFAPDNGQAAYDCYAIWGWSRLESMDFPVPVNQWQGRIASSGSASMPGTLHPCCTSRSSPTVGSIPPGRTLRRAWSTTTESRSARESPPERTSVDGVPVPPVASRWSARRSAPRSPGRTPHRPTPRPRSPGTMPTGRRHRSDRDPPGLSFVHSLAYRARWTFCSSVRVWHARTTAPWPTGIDVLGEPISRRPGARLCSRPGGSRISVTGR